MEKPLSVKIDEFKTGVGRLCNESGLPTILLEPIIKDLYMELRTLNAQIAEKEKREWEESQRNTKTT